MLILKKANKAVVVAGLIDRDLFNSIKGNLTDEERTDVVVTNYIDADEDTVKNDASERHIDLAVVDIAECSEKSGQKKFLEICTHGALNKDGDMTEILMIYSNKDFELLMKLQQELFKRKIPVYPLKFDDRDNEMEKRLVFQNIRANIRGLKKEKQRYCQMVKEADEMIDAIGDEKESKDSNMEIE